MNRDYLTGTSNVVNFFTGIEIEHTPAYGLKTLFVVGIKPLHAILNYFYEENCSHIYLGANHSFKPDQGIGDEFSSYETWNNLISFVLYSNILTTLDFDVHYAEWISTRPFINNNLFIPQISVKIPNIRNFNYNSMLKIDDKDFKASNPGVWCHRLHNLQDDKIFTDWNKYSKDNPL